jgi:hypothetical protein
MRASVRISDGLIEVPDTILRSPQYSPPARAHGLPDADVMVLRDTPGACPVLP